MTETTKKRTLSHNLFLPIRGLYKVHIFLCFALWLLLFYPVLYYYLKNAKRLRGAFPIIKIYTHIFHTLSLLPPRIKGTQNFPVSGAYLVCFNHGSFLDITNAYNVMKDYFVFVGKKELKQWPLFQIFFLSEMNILIDRKSRIDAYKGFVKMGEELEKGNPVAIFPEGTMTKKGWEMNTFKPGAFITAIQKQVPIVPITYLTHWKRIENGGFWHGIVSPGFCDVIIHPPISTIGLLKTDVEILSQQVFDIINAPLIAANTKKSKLVH